MHNGTIKLSLKETRHTAETGIKFTCVFPTEWRHVDCNESRNAQVGPSYKSKEELLLDHDDYLQRAGWMKDCRLVDPVAMDGTLAEIAKKHLGIVTLETQNRDHKDFHDLSVHHIKAALQAAFKAGCDQNRQDSL